MLTLDLDLSALAQVVSFLILFVGLKNLIFDPTLRIIEERERRTSGAKHAAVDLRAESEHQAAEYEATMQRARSEVGSSTEATRAQIEQEERAIIAAARDESTSHLTVQRDQLLQAAGTARAALASEAAQLASQMFEKVVGRPSA